MSDERARIAVQAQLDAYNAHDVDSFVACYSPDVEVRDLRTGALSSHGRESMRSGYGTMFERFPTVHASVINRTIVGDLVFDHEYVTGRGEPLFVMAIYEVNDVGMISKVWFGRPG